MDHEIAIARALPKLIPTRVASVRYDMTVTPPLEGMAQIYSVPAVGTRDPPWAPSLHYFSCRAVYCFL